MSTTLQPRPPGTPPPARTASGASANPPSSFRSAPPLSQGAAYILTRLHDTLSGLDPSYTYSDVEDVLHRDNMGSNIEELVTLEGQQRAVYLLLARSGGGGVATATNEYDDEDVQHDLHHAAAAQEEAAGPHNRTDYIMFTTNVGSLVNLKRIFYALRPRKPADYVKEGLATETNIAKEFVLTGAAGGGAVGSLDLQNDILVGSLTGEPLSHFAALHREVITPVASVAVPQLLSQQHKKQTEKPTARTDSFLQSIGQRLSQMEETLQQRTAGATDLSVSAASAILQHVTCTPTGYQKASHDVRVVIAVERVVTGWCELIEDKTNPDRLLKILAAPYQQEGQGGMGFGATGLNIGSFGSAAGRAPSAVGGTVSSGSTTTGHRQAGKIDVALLPDTCGPEAELQAWRQFALDASMLLERAAEQDVQALLAIVHHARPQLEERWAECLADLRSAKHQAAEVIKYLHPLLRYYKPLLLTEGTAQGGGSSSAQSGGTGDGEAPPGTPAGGMGGLGMSMGGPGGKPGFGSPSANRNASTAADADDGAVTTRPTAQEDTGAVAPQSPSSPLAAAVDALPPSNPLQEAIPLMSPLVQNIQLVHDIVPYYKQEEEITKLLVLSTNQVITACKNAVRSYGRVWDQCSSIPKLKRIIQYYCDSMELARTYREEFTQNRIGGENVDELKVFGKLELFVRRLAKLLELFQTVLTFRTLKQYNLEHFEPLSTRFFSTFEDLKRKSGDPLDYAKPNFDKDHFEFSKQVSEIDCSLQVYVNSSFESVPQTVPALQLLEKFRLLMQRDALRADLDVKYLVLFHGYGNELEAVQRVYERNKADPPIARNAPPIAGRVFWARHLRGSIEAPMRRFQEAENGSFLAMHHRETKKIVRLFNRIATALTEYEVMWLATWTKAIEAARSSLQATVAVRDDETGDLAVNFDHAVLELMRETLWLVRGGASAPSEIPAAALDVYRRQSLYADVQRLEYLFNRFKEVCETIPLPLRPAMVTHIDSVEQVIQPGLASVAWLSLNLGQYLDSVAQAVEAMASVVQRATDVLDNRIQVHLKNIARIEFFKFPSPASTAAPASGGGGGGTSSAAAGVAVPSIPSPSTGEAAAASSAATPSLSLEEFKELQEQHLKTVCEQLRVSNEEVCEAVVDLCQVLDPRWAPEGRNPSRSPSSTPAQASLFVSSGSMNATVTTFGLSVPSEAAEALFKLFSFYHRQLLKAVLNAVIASFHTLRKQLGASSPDYFVTSNNAFLEVHVELDNPQVVLCPCIDDIQLTLNECVAMALRATDSIGYWVGLRGAYNSSGEASSFFDEISRNKEVVKGVLLLAGCISGLQRQVEELINGLTRFEYLWTKDRQRTLKRFQQARRKRRDSDDEGDDDGDDQVLLTSHSLPYSDGDSEEGERASPTFYPPLEAYEVELKACSTVASELNLLPDTVTVGSLLVECTPFKSAATREIVAWRRLYGDALHGVLAQRLNGLFGHFDGVQKRVIRPITDDATNVRGEMITFDQVRDWEWRIELELQPLESAFSVLQRHEISFPTDSLERVQDLRARWRRVRGQSATKAEELKKIQHCYRRDLLEAVSKFGVEMVCLRNDYDANGPAVAGLAPLEAMERLRRFQRTIGEKLRRWTNNYESEGVFGLPQHQYPELASIVRELHSLDRLYTLYATVTGRIKDFGKVMWYKANLKSMAEEMFSLQERVRALPVAVKRWPAYTDMKKVVDDFFELHPVMEQLSHPSVRERHWNDVMKLCGTTWSIARDTFVVGDLFEANLITFKDDIIDLAASSEKEGGIELRLNNISKEWKERELSFAEFKHRGFITLKADDTAALKEALEEALVLLGSTLASRYIAPFRAEALSWSVKLNTITEVLTLWLEVQSLWTYLEAVFAAGDIMKQLPAEAKRFAMIDKQWVRIFYKATEVCNVVDFCYGNDMLKALPYLKDQLECCQRALAHYLEQKRNAFSRFYFVSDSVLLEVLSQGSDPRSMQPHFSAIFDGIAQVAFDGQSKKPMKIKAMESFEGESVPLVEMLPCEGNIEDWLQQLCNDMQRTVRFIMREAVTDLFNIGSNQSLLGRFFYNYPSQVVVTAVQILWTKDVTHALQYSNPTGPKQSERKETSKKLLGIKELLADHIRLLDMSPAHRIHVQTLITMAVHNYEIWEQLKRTVKDPSSFEWQKQLRFHWTEKDKCILRIADADMTYSDEYLGIKERLVITPLTDRCYITLSQAMSMYMGGAPAGPAGTGKTETVKDLGRAAGKYVVVFNCSDQWDFRSLGKIFKGLAQSGSWGCFDEFNRISLPVLSVVSHQIHTLFHAMRQHRSDFNWIDGGHVRLNPSVGVFITMNPGYAGRQELPENLKALFRGISMMAPERQVIMKVKLAAAGYKQDEKLSKKFNILYQQCEQQLSAQRHYDFGLRSILSVLRSAGDVLKKVSTSSGLQSKVVVDEEAIFMRTVKDMNLSKLVFDDVPVFLSLLTDLFPTRIPDIASYPELENALKTHAQDLQIIATPEWITKCVQIYETKLVRHGLMVIGPAGSGKTTCFQALLKGLHEVEGKHREVRMNPKAITSQQMFGTMDSATGDWTDGVFSYLWRRHNRDRHVRVWLICDGPVDTLWIESLNTVLDDNKLLTLANGDRILMAPTLKMCFEAEDLRNASPATVSRAGIIYLSLEDVGWQPVYTAQVDHNVSERIWAATSGQAFAENGLKHFDALYLIVSKRCTPPMLLTMQHIVSNTVRVANSYCDELMKLPHALHTKEAGEMIFWFAVAWAFGGPLDLKDRAQISTAIESMSTPGLVVGDIFKLFPSLSPNNGVTWGRWADVVPTWTPMSGMHSAPFINLNGVFVPTEDSVVLQSLLKGHHDQHLPCLLIGSTGSAKTVTIEQFLVQTVSQNDNFAWKKTNLSQATTPQLLQSVLEDLCEKRMGATYGPKRNKQLTLFVDDLNMAHRNEWGDQDTCELLRQVIEFGGMYSLQRIGEWKRIVDMFFFASLTISSVRQSSGEGGGSSGGGGGTSVIPNRLRRHFTLLNVPLPPHETLQSIFGRILEARFHGSQLAVTVPAIMQATVKLWTLAQTTLLPTPSRFYYSFNLQDLARLTQGICMCPVKGTLHNTDDGIALWANEITHVLCDKLNHIEDVKWFNDQLQNTVKEVWGAGHQVEFTMRTSGKGGNAVRYTSFAIDASIDPETGEERLGERIYQPTTLAIINAKLEELLRKHNSSRKAKKLSIVLFETAVEHVLRIVRVLATPRGSMLLIGLGGSGKQSLTRLAAFAQGYPLFQPTINVLYNTQSWFDDLRAQYVVAGVTGPTTFLLTDAEVKDEEFLEYINSILASGEVPGLFSADDRETTLGSIRSVAKLYAKKEFEDSEEWLWNYFINRVRNNLHFVLCFTPQRNKFQARVRRFPAIVAGCQLNYYFPWPNEALLDVSKRSVDENTPLKDTVGVVASRLPATAAAIHTAIRDLCEEYFAAYRFNIGNTPKLFLSFLELFNSLYKEKLEHHNRTGESLLLGLRKLHEAKEDVDRLRVELKGKEATLQEATRETDALLKEISIATDAAEVTRREIAKVADKLSKEHARIAAGRAAAEADLVAAQPALIAAKEALDQISQNDIKTLKVMQKPPEMIRRIFDAVNILMHAGVDSVAVTAVNGKLTIVDSWINFGRAVCASVDLFDRLQAFCGKGKDQLNDETCELLQPYLMQEDFTQERARLACGNVAGLCTWSRAMVTYHEISKFVAPKIEALNRAEAELQVANRALQEKMSELEAAEEEVARHMEKLNAAKARKEALEADALTTRRKVEYATELIAALPEERQRWEQGHHNLSDLIRRLVGDCMLAAAFITYGVAFNAKYREKLLFNVIHSQLIAHQVPCAPKSEFNFRKFLVEEETVALWQLQSLPMDEQSIDNAIMLTKGHKVPLLVDPQEQGIRWLLNYLQHELDEKLRIEEEKEDLLKQAEIAKKKKIADAIKGKVSSDDDESGREPRTEGEEGSEQEKEGDGGEGDGEKAASPTSPSRIPEPEMFAGEDIPTATAAGAMAEPAAPKAPTKTLAVVTMKDKNFMQILEQQLALGAPLVIEGVTTTDPFLDALLERRVTKTGRRQVINLLGEQYDYHDEFSLYLTTKTPHFSFETELYAKVAILNFSVTIRGLHEQLLARVIQSERQELEHHKAALLVEIQQNQQKLSSIEQELLAKLSSVEGSLVDDESLMATLANSKASYVEVKKSLETAEETRKHIDQARAEYAAVALRGAVLYFVAVDVAQVNHCYQLSLAKFIYTFDQGLSLSAPSSQVSHRIASIVEKVTELFFVYVGRGLFEIHKTLFILLMSTQVDIHNGHVSAEAFSAFLRGGTLVELEDLNRNFPKPYGWLPKETWRHVVALQQSVPRFRHLLEFIKRDEAPYRAMVDAERPETVSIPDFSDATPFERLLLVRALREDKVFVATTEYAKEVLGPFFAQVPPYDLEEIVTAEVTSRDPILFLLSAGGDPTAQLEAVAKKRKKGLHSLSLGQGQEAAAMSLLEQCCGSGDWVVFQNCHLGIQFLNSLEAWVLQGSKHQAAAASTVAASSNPTAAGSGTTAAAGAAGQGGSATAGAGPPTATQRSAVAERPELRVWLTCTPTDEFPIALLHKCVKLTNEPPQGMAASMTRACSWLTQDTYEMFRRSEWRPALYSLCYLHAVLLERRQYGAQGWCTPYQFSDGDWQASMLFLQNHFAAHGDNEKRTGPIPWEGVRFMVGDIQYGGRVTSLRDRVTLQTAVDKVFHSRINETGMFLCGELKKFPIPEPTADLSTIRQRVANTFTAHEPPPVVGLHPNAELAQRSRQTNLLLGTILTIQPKAVAVASGATRDETVQGIAEQALKRLPKALKPSKVKEDCKRLGAVLPLTIFFGLEVNRLSDLIRLTYSTLNSVLLASAGTVTMTPELEAVCDALYAGTVPTLFLTRSWQDTTFSSWLNNLQVRYSQQTEFLQNGTLKVFSLAHFANPRGFLSSLRQEACRRHSEEGWALDRVENRFDVMRVDAPDVDNPPDEGAYLCNLSLEGASWDRQRHRLRQPIPKELFNDLPVVHVHAVLVGARGAAVGMGGATLGAEGNVWNPAPPTGATGPTSGGVDSLLQHRPPGLGTLGRLGMMMGGGRGEGEGPGHTLKKVRIPCYINPKRGDEAVVCEMDLPHDDPDPFSWILRGAAVLCNKNI